MSPAVARKMSEQGDLPLFLYGVVQQPEHRK